MKTMVSDAYAVAKGSAIDTAINSLALALFSFGSVALTQGKYIEGILLGLSGMSLEFFKYGLRRWKRICEGETQGRERRVEHDRITVMLNDALGGNQ